MTRLHPDSSPISDTGPISEGAQSLAAVEERLASEFATPLGGDAVKRSMAAAAAGLEYFGDDPRLQAGLVERMARNELELLLKGRNDRAWT